MNTQSTYTFSPAEEKAEQTPEQIARAAVKDGWLWYGRGPLKVLASGSQMNDVVSWASEHRNCFWASGVFGLSPELFYALRAGSEIARLNGLKEETKTPEPKPVSEPSGIEAQVCKDITDRQAVGIKKYGTTVADNPLSLKEWLQHAYEESIDHSIYLKRAMAEMDKEPVSEPVKAREWEAWELNGDLIGHPHTANVSDDLLKALGWKKVTVREVVEGRVG